MTDRQPAHLDPATIAALVDRTLDAPARAAAEAHLSECAGCREVWVETSEIANDMAHTAAHTPAAAPHVVVLSHRPRSRRWIYAAAGLAAAATIAIAAITWDRRAAGDESGAVDDLIADVGQRRFSTARLSAPFEWGTPPSVQRGDTPAAASLAIQRRAIDLQQLAERNPTAENLRASALGMLAVGRTDDAIEALTRAVRLRTDYMEGRVDLGAALLERWRRDGETTEAVKALDETRRALDLDRANAPARFNYALALEALEMRAQAIEAWKAYIAIDASSPWATEAREHVRALEQAVSSRTSGRGSIDDVERGGAAPASAGCALKASAATVSWRREFEAGQSEAALRAADEASAHLRCAGIRDIDSQSRRSVSLLELGRLDEAETAAASVMASPAADFPRSHARALQIRGLVEYQRGRFSTAVDYVERSVAAATSAGDPEFATALRTLLASLFDQQGAGRESWAQLRHALAGLDGVTSPRRRYAILASATQQAAAVDLDGAALVFADALIEATSDWPNAVGRAIGFLQRAQAYDKLGHAREASADLDAASALIPTIQSDAVRRDLTAQVQLAAGAIEKDPEAAVRSLTAALEEFTRSENTVLAAPALLARGRALQKAGRAAEARRDWLRGLDLVEDQREEIRGAQLRVSRLDRVWDLYEEMIRLERGSPLTSLEFAERGRARQLLDALANGRTVTPLAGRALFTTLPAGVQGIVYASLRDELFVWHVTPAEVTLDIHAIGRDRLTALIEGYRNAIAAGSPAFSLELSRLLLPASLQTDPDATLLIAPDGPLHAFPFGALRAAATDRFLVERATPVIVASLTSAHESRLSAGNSPARALLIGVGDPAPRSGLPRLPGVRAEMAALADLYPGARALIDDGASPSDAARAMRTAGLIHFAGHAIVEPRYPSQSRLIFGNASGDYSMTVGTIASLSLSQGAIVVLGACDTAIGVVSRGEGAAAIARAFLAAGASSVLASLWRVNDRETSDFLVDVHRTLSRGVPAARALAAAQRAWIQSGRHANAWAAFEMTGSIPRERSK